MKKNISINIGGIIFHIEEDGYERLKSYLDSINKYFSTFEDSKEIIDDIENRIAEILLQKLSDGKQVVVAEDIDDLVGTMGTVADFEATIETEQAPEPASPGKAGNGASNEGESESSGEKEEETRQQEGTTKGLYRDSKRRILGGVAAGMAHYFGIDALWIRLIFLALLFNIFIWGFSGAIFLIYIILWIVLPAKNNLEEDKTVKKLYRNPDDRVLGGVAAGIASYFGTDITVIRVLFVLSIFLGGTGIVLYIVLWIITPEAKSITEKMQMQGEPVTLSNIEKNVKKSFNVKEGEENVLVKILLFPFRLIALIISALGEILGPLLRFLVEAIRIVFGVFIIVFGFVVMFAMVVSLLVLLGVGSAWDQFVYFDSVPMELFTGTIDPVTSIALFAATFIPAIALVLLGLIVILRRSVANAYVGWSLFGIWIVALAITAFMIPQTVQEFRVEDEIRKETTFEMPSGIPTLELNDMIDHEFESVDLRLRGHSDSNFVARVRVEARGESHEEARKNAEAIGYNVTQSGDKFVFDRKVNFSDAAFRFQQVDVLFYIPFEQPFKMDPELSKILSSTLRRDGYRDYQLKGNTWKFTEAGLVCITCEDDRGKDRTNTKERRRESLGSVDWTEASGKTEKYGFSDFNEIQVSRLINIKIVRSDEYRVEIVGDADDLDDVRLVQSGDELEIEFEREWNWMDEDEYKGNRIWAFISMPDIERLDLTGGCKGEIQGFTMEDFEINLSGASSLFADLDADELNVNVTGASKMDIRGKTKSFEAKVLGASFMDAFSLESREAIIEVLGASKADLYATDEIEIEAAGLSTVRYKGTDNAKISSSGMSSVSAE